jgi:hypothetical protein
MTEKRVFPKPLYLYQIAGTRFIILNGSGGTRWFYPVYPNRNRGLTHSHPEWEHVLIFTVKKDLQDKGIYYKCNRCKAMLPDKAFKLMRAASVMYRLREAESAV